MYITLYTCILHILQLMTTEDWHNVYHKASRPWLRAPFADFITPIYFTTAVVIGGCILSLLHYHRASLIQTPLSQIKVS